MSISGKVWGETELLEANGALEFHRIRFKAGYQCSEHKHEFKWNGFFVESGEMIAFLRNIFQKIRSKFNTR